MMKTQGFSLYEVFIAILLVASLSHLLLKQQWQARQMLNSGLLHLRSLFLLNNVAEGYLAHVRHPVDSPWTLKTSMNNSRVSLSLQWTSNSNTSQSLFQDVMICEP